MTEAGFDVSGASIAWHEISQIRYSAVDHYLNHHYMGTTLTVAVAGSGKRRVRFKMESGTNAYMRRVDPGRRDRNRAEFEKAVAVLDERVGNRLVSEAVTAVRAGGTAELGGLRLDPQGAHKPGLLRKSVRWHEVAGTDVNDLNLMVLVRNGDRVKKAIAVPRNGWNVVLLPRVIGILAAAARA
jgi:hypothetical protein